MKFLSREIIYRILQRELPDGVYADGAPEGHYSTADMDSIADAAATAYGNLERIYSNFFPQTADEKIDDWLWKVFGKKFDSSLTLADKRARVIEKIRKQPTIRLWEILKIVASFLPEGKYCQIIEFGCDSGRSWLLGESELGVNTFLGFSNTFANLGVDATQWCPWIGGQTYWRLGDCGLGDTTILSYVDFLEIVEPQIDAFVYLIRIFEHEVTGLDYSNMIEQITAQEPARSAHIIAQNLNLTDYFLTNIVNNVDETSGINAITRSATSTTGYKGITV